MKAISIRQPEASLILLGFTGYHTRAWSIGTPQTLLIHAAARMDHRDEQAFDHRWVRAFFRKHNIYHSYQLPLGGIIGRVTVMATYPAEHAIAIGLPFSAHDTLFTRFREHHSVLELADQRSISNWPCAGGYGVFDVEPPNYVLEQLQIRRFA